MSNVDPFVLIARDFPFKKRLELCDEDEPRLIMALINEIAIQVDSGYKANQYCLAAARHIVYLKKDYSLAHAAAYFEHVRKIPKIHLNQVFFKSGGVQEIVQEIFTTDPETTPVESTEAEVQTPPPVPGANAEIETDA